MGEEKGPGHTKFIANEDGSIWRRQWNDPSWTTRYCDASDLVGALAPDRITRMLADAYEMGRDDQREIVRRAIGASK